MAIKISTKGRYALRFMLDLAINNTGEYIPIKNISERQGISVKYLEQIIAAFNCAGFVRSTRGSQGGYKLAKPPEEYTVGMILRLTEGSLVPVACMENNSDECQRQSSCVTLEIWKKVHTAICSVVDHITLADLVNMQKTKSASPQDS